MRRVKRIAVALATGAAGIIWAVIKCSAAYRAPDMIGTNRFNKSNSRPLQAGAVDNMNLVIREQSVPEQKSGRR